MFARSGIFLKENQKLKITGTMLEKSQLEKHLEKYVSHVDCWGSCDILKISSKIDREKLFKLAKEYTKSKEPFKVRVGLKIMFSFVQDSKYKYEIFKRS